MNASNRLIALYRERLHLTTNQAIANRLGVRQPTVSMWLNEKSNPDASSVEKMCIAIDEPLRDWLPRIEADRARTPADRMVWLRFAQATAAVALGVGLYAFGRPDVQTDSLAALLFAARNPGTLYIMSNLLIVGMALAWYAQKHGQRQCLDTIPA